MKKRILSMALALCICLTMLMPAGVWAENTGAGGNAGLSGNDVAEVTIDDTAISYSDIDAAFNAAQAAGSAVIKLLQNVTTEKDCSYSLKQVTLDLNGYNIGGYNQFEIAKGELAVTDSGKTKGEFKSPLNIAAGAAVHIGAATVSGDISVSGSLYADSDDTKINSAVTVNDGGTFATGDGAAPAVDKLNILAGGKASLGGGTFSSITAAEGVKLKEFLADNMKYWSLNSDNKETFIAGGTNSITDAGIIVIHACEHQWVYIGECGKCGDTHAHTAPNDKGKCDICGYVIEAEVGGAYYTELYYAMYAASEMDNKPVVLMYADSHPLNTSGVCMVPDGDYTINTNGKSIEVSMMSINGKLYITGGGTIDSEIWINNTLTIMNTIVTGPVTVNYSESANGSLTANFSQINGKLTVVGGKAEINMGTELKGGILVKGGTVTDEYGVKISGAEVIGGTMTITQGKIEDGSELAVKGGTVNIRDYAYISKITADGGALDISGGTIRDFTVNSGDVRLTGGKYINGITLADGLSYTDILADGYAFVDSGGNMLKAGDMKSANNFTVGKCTNSTEVDSDGKCPYCGLQFIAEAGGIKYTTITAALNADSNVKLIADADINEQLVINADGAVIDLNGKTIKCNVIGEAILVSGGSLTIRDSSSSGNGRIIDRCNETSAGICVSGGSLTIESGNYEASGDYSTAVKQTGGSLEIKGGTFTVGNSEKSYTVLIERGTSFKVSGNAEMKAERANAGRCLFIGKGFKGEVSLADGSYAHICIEDGGTVTIGELLADGYGFKTGEGKWATETELAGSDIGNVTVAEAPIKSIEDIVSGSPASYGYKGAAVPIMKCSISGTQDANKYAQYQWYEVTENGAEPVGDGDYIYMMPEGRDVGAYTYYCTASYDGYTVTGNTVTVTVTPADITDSLFNRIIVKQVSYSGSAHNTADVITFITNYGGSDEKTLTAGIDFDITGDISATDAGTYSICIEAKGRYTGKQNAEWTIDPAELTIDSVEIAPKKYDGSTDAEITNVVFKGLMGNDTAAYTVENAKFNSADADKANTVTGRVILDSSVKNYVLKSDKFSISKGISKADAPNNLADIYITKKCAETGEKTVSVADAGMPKDAGALAYTKGTATVTGDAKVDNWNVASDGSVTYILSGGNAGDVITLPVTISSVNYEDVTVNVVVTLTDKEVPTVTAEDITVTYDGKAVSADKIRGTAKFDGRTVAGKWSWKEGTKVTDVADSGEKTVVFTPDDTDTYATSETNIRVTINRAEVKGSPKYTAITESGKTLSDAGLTADGSTFSTAGTVKWADDDTTEVRQGNKYKWIFTPDSDNYNILTGEITLWPYSSGGDSSDDVKTTTDSETSEKTTGTTVKDSKTETVKNEQGEDISKVTAKVSDKIADKLVDEAVSNKSDNVEITVKPKDGNNTDGEKQTEIEIPKKTIDSIAKNTEADLVIKTDNGQVAIDNKDLGTIAAAADGDTLRIIVTANMKLKEAQKPAADAIGSTGVIFEMSAYIGNTRIYDLKAGKAEILLPLPENLKDKDIAVIHINDKGICEIINHTVETVEASSFVKFETSQFANYAIVEKANADKLIEKQNIDKIKNLIKDVKLKAATSKTAKKSVKVKISGVKNLSSLIKEADTMGYTVKYKYYRSVKKSSKYTAKLTKKNSTYINTKGRKGTKYYYKAKVLVYDGKTLIAQTALKQCGYGVMTWSK